MIRGSLAVLGAAAALAAVPAIASATPLNTLSQNVVSSSTVSLGNFSVNGGISSIAALDLDVAAKAQWKGNYWTTVSWDDADLRAGSKINVFRGAAVQLGTMHVTWNVSGRVNPLSEGYESIGSMNVSADANCAPLTSGGNFDCVATAPALNLINTPGIPLSPYVKVVFKARFTVTPEGAVIKRTFSTVNGSTALSGLSLGLTPQSETLDVPCAPGTDAGYAINSIHYTPTVSAVQQPSIQAGLRDPLGWTEMPAVFDKAFGPAFKSTPSFDLAGTGQSVALGTVKASRCGV